MLSYPWQEICESETRKCTNKCNQLCTAYQQWQNPHKCFFFFFTWLLKQVTAMSFLTLPPLEWDVLRLLHFKDSPAEQTEGLTSSAIKGTMNFISLDEIKHSSNNTGLSLLIDASYNQFVFISQLITHREIPSITNTQSEFHHSFHHVKSSIYSSVLSVPHFISVLLVYWE